MQVRPAPKHSRSCGRHSGPLASTPVLKERVVRKGAKMLPPLRLVSDAPASARVSKGRVRKGAQVLQADS